MHKIAITIARVCCLTKESKTSRHILAHTLQLNECRFCDCNCECAHVSLSLCLYPANHSMLCKLCFKSAFEARERERTERKIEQKEGDLILFWNGNDTHIMRHTVYSAHIRHRVIERNAISFIESLGGNWFFLQDISRKPNICWNCINRWVGCSKL